MGAIYPQDMLTEWGEDRPNLFLRVFQKHFTPLHAQQDNMGIRIGGGPAAARSLARKYSAWVAWRTGK